MLTFRESFTADGQTIDIKRIDTANVSEGYKWIPIENDAYFLIFKYFSDDPCFLPKLYTALTYLTGPGDDFYDDYKGSYSFRFELNVKKNGLLNTYLYHIYHKRSYVEFSLYQRVPKTDPRDPEVMAQPNDEVFSDRDICSFSYFLCKYALKSMEEVKYKPKPFVKWADSNLLLFGFADGEFFSNSYKDYEQYQKEKEQKKLNIEEAQKSD